MNGFQTEFKVLLEARPPKTVIEDMIIDKVDKKTTDAIEKKMVDFDAKIEDQDCRIEDIDNKCELFIERVDELHNAINVIQNSAKTALTQDKAESNPPTQGPNSDLAAAVS